MDVTFMSIDEDSDLNTIMDEDFVENYNNLKDIQNFI